MKGPKGKAPGARKGATLAKRQAFKAKLKAKASTPRPVAAPKAENTEPQTVAVKTKPVAVKAKHVAAKPKELSPPATLPIEETTDASDSEDDESGKSASEEAAGEEDSSDTASTASSDEEEEDDQENTPVTPASERKSGGSSVFVYDMSKEGSMSSGMSFADCQMIQPSLRRQLDFLKFKEMTNVQREAIPALIKSSKDALIRSETGSGKTLAFLVPAINNILCAEAAKRKAMIQANVLRNDDARTPVFARSDGTRVIVISPTRELAVQTVETAQKLTQAWPWMTTAALVSGTKRKSEKASLRKGITILVTTPGRILDHLDTTNSFDSRRLSTLVLDEVDRLLDLGFESKLRRITSELKENMKSTKMMRNQIAALAAGEECEKLIVDKDMFEAQRQAQREIARSLLRESMKTSTQKIAALPKVYDEDEEDDDKSDEPKIIEQDSSTTKPRSQGTVIDMSEEEEEEVVASPAVKVEAKKAVAPRLLNAADSGKYEPDRESFQVVIVSATLNPEIEKLAKFCLSSDATWIHGKEAKALTPSTDLEEVTEVASVTEDKQKWDVPKSLKQAYIKLGTPKQRLLVLMSLLMMRIPKKKRTIVFVNNCEAVEFLHAFCEAVKWPNPPDSLKRKRPGDFDGRKEKSKIREKARQMLTEVDDVLFQMSEDEAESNVQNSKDSLFTAKRVLEGLSAYRLHGSMSRDDRVGNLGDFNHCRDAAVIFATDVAARGLNMPEVDLVIHLDAPVEVSDYIHRIGRTARMGTQGTSVLFLNEHETGYVKVLETAGACPNGIKESKEETLLSMWAPPTARTTKVASFLPDELKKLRASDAQNFLMSRFTMFVEDDSALTDLAQKAYLSTVKTYRVYGETMRDHFDFGKLHLGHLAGSFLLRRSPNDIAASQQPQDAHSSSARGRSAGPIRGAFRGGDRSRGSDRGGFRGDRVRSGDRGSFRGGDRGSFRGGDRGSFRGGDRGSFRGGDRGSFRGGDRSFSRGSSRGGFRGGSSRGGDRGGFREVRSGGFERGGRGGSRGGFRGSSRGGRRDE